jgi:hypothetical protein
MAIAQLMQVTRLPAAMMITATRRLTRLPQRASSIAWEKSERQNRHSPLIWQRPAKVLQLAEGAAQHTDIGSQHGKQRRQTAEPWIARRVAERHQKQRIGQAVRDLVEQSPSRSRFPAFDRDHAVEQLANQAELNANRRHDEGRPSRAPPEQGAAQHSPGDRQNGYLIGRDPRAGQTRREILRPARGARRQRSPCLGRRFGHASPSAKIVSHSILSDQGTVMLTKNS